jgi:diguanylate cyclase (GGDEF)-like protein
MMGGVVLIHSVVVGIRSLAGRLDDARAEAERLAATDALTGVANRREFNRTLRNTDARHHHARGVLIADIDHFKQINDSLGHLYGDDVLAAVGQSLVSSFPNGLVARWGGEEFAVLTEPIDQERLELAAAAACLAVSSSTVATISIGAVLWTPGVSVEAALVAADRALYEAKAAGRNRAHVARRAAVSAPA